MNQLSARKRLALLAFGYLVYVLCGPGMLSRAGTPFGALGLIPWALAASRPGPWKKRIEWFAGACALTAQTTWMGIVFWFAIPWLFVGYGCWSVWGGWLMKKLAMRLPLTLATPLAWVGYESLLTWTPPPIGLSWLRLGHYLNDVPLLAGSGRLWGVMGVGFLLATCAGFLADIWRAARPSDRVELGRLAPLAFGAVLGLGLGASLMIRPPETVAGPRLLLVQPAFEQARKQSSGSPQVLFRESFELMRSGLDDLKARAERAPDLVVWGETMLQFPTVEPGLAERILELEVDPWHPIGEFEPDQRVDSIEFLERRLSEVLMTFFGGELSPGRFMPATLEEGTSFLSGIEVMIEREGRLRRSNSVMLWSRDLEAPGRAEKRHLAPGGETMVGLENFAWVRDIIYEVAGYVPDLAPAEEFTRLSLPNASGEAWDLGPTICFDNAFTDSYVGPLREGDVDFHLVVSNEAWYEDSQELDQMIAFSRLHAICTGRSLVRCANSGISAAFGVRGEELARLEVEGVDRQVPGTLVVDVPVPVADQRASRTPFIWLDPWLDPLAAFLPLLLLFLIKPRSAPAVERG